MLGLALILFLGMSGVNLAYGFPIPVMAGVVTHLLPLPLWVLGLVGLLAWRWFYYYLKNQWSFPWKIIILVFISLNITWVIIHPSHSYSPARITPELLSQQLHSDNPPLVIDSRRPIDFAHWHLKGAKNRRGYKEIFLFLDQHTRTSSQPVVILCYGGFYSFLLIHYYLNSHIPQKNRQLNDKILILSGGYSSLRTIAHHDGFAVEEFVPRFLAQFWGKENLLVGQQVSDNPLLRRSWKGFLYMSGLLHLLTGGVWMTFMVLLGLQSLAFIMVQYWTRPREWKGSLKKLWMPHLSVLSAGTFIASRIFSSDPVFYGKSHYIMEATSIESANLQGILLLLGSLLAVWLWLLRFGSPIPASRHPLMTNPSLRSSLYSNADWFKLALLIILLFQIITERFLISYPGYLYWISSLFVAVWIDVMVSWILKQYLTHQKSPERMLLQWMGVRFYSGLVSVELETVVPDYPGRFLLKTGGGPFHLGKLTGMPYSPSSGSERISPIIAQEDSQFYWEETRAILKMMPQPLLLQWNVSQKLIHVELLKIEALPPIHQDIDSLLFSSSSLWDRSIYQAQLPLAYPLSVDIQQKRCSPQGSQTRARQWYGGFGTSAPLKWNGPICLIGAQVYMPCENKEIRISMVPRSFGEKWLQQISQRLMQLELPLMLLWWESEVYPETQARIRKLDQIYRELSLSLPNSWTERRLRRHIARRIPSLWGNSAFWQDKVSVLHRNLYEKFVIESVIYQIELSTLLASNNEVTPRHYEFSDSLKDTDSLHGDSFPKSLQKRRIDWQQLESLRQQTQKSYLKELQCYQRFFAKLEKRWEIQGHGIFLLAEEWIVLLNRKNPLSFLQQLRPLMEDRKRRWQLRQKYSLPVQLTPSIIEYIQIINNSIQDPLTLEPSQAFQGIRVSGEELSVRGRIQVHSSLDGCFLGGPNTILIMPNLSPEDLYDLPPVTAIILEQGNVLSHTSIIAREQKRLMVVGMSDACTRFQTGQILTMVFSEKTEMILEPSSRPWISLDDPLIDDSMGVKAFQLATLKQQGFPVLPGVVLLHEGLQELFGDDFPDECPTAFYPNASWIDEFQTQLKALASVSTTLLLRSSANFEDLNSRSHAGIFKSIVSSDNTRELFKNLGEIKTHATHWMKDHSDSDGSFDSWRFNILIQPWIPTSVGGVIFTQSPLPNHSSDWIMNFSDQGPQPVVQGAKSVMEVVWNKQTSSSLIRSNHPSLSDHELQELFEMTLRIEVFLGGIPQDIEWLLHENQIWILQSRPIVSRFLT